MGGRGADEVEKRELFEEEGLSIHIYALSPAPVKVCLPIYHI